MGLGKLLSLNHLLTFLNIPLPRIAKMDMDTSKLHWGHQEYNLGEFAEKFKDSFPKIINVTVGFLGQQELDSISSSTHIMVHSLLCQQRAVFESKHGKVLSLPVIISTVGFYIIRNERREGPPISLQAILESNPLPVIIQPITPLVLPWLSGGHRLDTLTITRTYEEQLLMGFPFSSKGILSRHTPLVLPMYMKEVRIALAEGLEGLDQGQFEDACATLGGQIDELGLRNLFIFQDITILNKQELIEKGHEYMEVKPIYMSLKNQGDEINLYQHLDFETTEPPTLQRKAARPPPLPPKPQYLQIARHKLPPLSPSLENNSQSFSGGSWHPLFCSLAEVPSNLRDLSVAQVCSCLRLLNLDQYCQAFEREQIDGDLLYTVEPSMMRETLGMESLHVGKLLRFREGWRPLLGSSGAEQVG
uniref:SAM domain-containing protein n=1 Tax=Hucho hucho TaxID=62062 RepID=A0A4W5M1S5_9TELE